MRLPALLRHAVRSLLPWCCGLRYGCCYGRCQPTTDNVTTCHAYSTHQGCTLLLHRRLLVRRDADAIPGKLHPPLTVLLGLKDVALRRCECQLLWLHGIDRNRGHDFLWTQ